MAGQSPTSAPQRDPSTDTATRSVVQNEASKILALINGGGTVAVATFLQAVWDNWGAEPRGMLIAGIAYLLVGTATVPVTLVLRYVNGLLGISFRPLRNPFWYLIILSYLVTLALFLFGMWQVIEGACLANENKNCGGLI